MLADYIRENFTPPSPASLRFDEQARNNTLILQRATMVPSPLNPLLPALSSSLSLSPSLNLRFLLKSRGWRWGRGANRSILHHVPTHRHPPAPHLPLYSLSVPGHTAVQKGDTGHMAFLSLSQKKAPEEPRALGVCCVR